MPAKRLSAASCVCLLFLSLGGFMYEAAAGDEEELSISLSTTAWQFAEEIAGNRPDNEALGAELPRTITLTFAGPVVEGNVVAIEYRLTGGAQFSSRDLNLADLSLVQETDDGAELLFTLLDGGSVGDSSVTFRMNAMGGGANDLALEGTTELRLHVPAVQKLPQDIEEAVHVEIHLTPEMTTTAGGFPLLAPLTHGVDGGIILQSVLVQRRDALTLTIDSPSLLSVIDAEDRSKFVDEADAVAITGAPGGRPEGIVLATLGFDRSETTALRQDGTPFELVTADLFHITVAGDFHANALAFIDLDGDETLDTGEAIPLTGGLTLAGSSPSVANLLSADRQVYFVTDTRTDLIPASFSVTLALDYADAGYVDETPLTAITQLHFVGIRQDGFAYAIPNCTQTDRARIRVTNETDSAVEIFMQALDQTGVDLGFVEVDASRVRGGSESRLLPHETLVLFTRHVELILGFNDGEFARDLLCEASDTWRGRAQLTFYASGDITVTPMLRGTDGRLSDLGGFTGHPVSTGRGTR